jgi:uncharacterized membrane protein
MGRQESNRQSMDTNTRAAGPGQEKPAPRDPDTGRLEAFSDGVFAIAITLLVLNLHVPLEGELSSGDLFAALGPQWPTYLAYVASFVFILVMWINHHQLFQLIGRANHPLMLFNGLLLMLIAAVPFTTALLAEYMRSSSKLNQREAVLVYNGLYIVIAIIYNVLWRYAAHERRLLDEAAHPAQVKRITDAYRLGPLSYIAALLLALVNIPASLLLNLLLAVYFALPRTRGAAPS